MIFNVRHLDELEHFGEGVNVFDETSQDGDLGQSSDSSVSWRRALIERAANNVRQVLHQPIEDETNYTSGQLVYDAKAKKFGRVLKSIPNYLKLSYVSGGSKEYSQKTKHSELVKNVPQKVAAAKKATQPAVKVEAKAVAKPKVTTAAKKAPVKVKAKTAAVAPTKKVTAKNHDAKKQKASVSVKAPIKKAAPVVSKNKKDLPKVSKTTAVAKNSAQRTIADPIADPNSYIKKHFKLMSNKDLAAATGLSEHTIRRKLGEWGLKRPSNQAAGKRKS